MRWTAAAILFTLAAAADSAAQTRPNVVLILADDLGYGDVGAFNPAGRIPTPHLDRLAREGLRLTDAHAAAALCTPTRYGLLTGRYPWRTRLPSGVLWGNGDALIEPNRTTVASLLRDAGYHTAGIGKWHLGLRWAALPGATPDRATNNEKAPLDWIDYGGRIADGPTHHGFVDYFGLTASLDMRDYVYIDGDRVPEPPTTTIAGVPSAVPAFHRPGRAGASFRPERVLGDLTSRAVQYVRDRGASQAPFFLYLALSSPHTPVLPSAAFAGRTGLGPYADFVAETDAAIGEVLQALEQSGAAKNTLVIFTSDNGPAPVAGMIESLRAQGHDSAGGWRGAKQDLYEGGHRVPTIVKWPGVVAPGTTSRAMVSLVDVLATLAEIVGRPLPEDAGEDSVSFLPVLRKPGGSNRAAGADGGPIRERIARDSRGTLEVVSGAGIGRPQRAGARVPGRAASATGAVVRPRGRPGGEDEPPGQASRHRPTPDGAAGELPQDRQEPVRRGIVRVVRVVAIVAIVAIAADLSFAQATHPISGRPIASVMGHEGAPWLERPEREAEEAPTKAITALQLRPGQTIADIGAGSGYYTMLLSAAVGPRGRVYATDIQPEMLALIRQKVEKRRLSNVELLLGTTTESRLPDGAIDVALMVDVYHELAQPQAFLQSLKRAFKPDGRLVLIEFRKESASVPIREEHKMSVREARMELEAEGYRFDRVIDVLPWQHILVFRPGAGRP